MILDGMELAETINALTSKQITYAEYFARTDDRIVAREMAGYDDGDRVSHTSGLKKYLVHLKASAMRQLGISTQLIAREIGVAAFAKPSDFFDVDPDLGLLSLKPLTEMEAEGAIKKIKFDKLGQVAEIEFYDKLAALKMLGDYVGMFKEGRQIAPAPKVDDSDAPVKKVIQIGHRPRINKSK